MIKIRRILFLLLGSISFIYYLICMAFAGFKLSFVWIWPLLSFFCFIRYKMLTFKLEGKTMWEPPKWLVYIYRFCIIAGLAAFVLVESRVVMSMNAKPQENLDYVIVLGAGMKGTTPTRPLQFRIQTAYDYMMDNPDTILIASGVPAKTLMPVGIHYVVREFFGFVKWKLF